MRPKHSSTRHFRLGRSVRRWGACLVLATTFWPAVARAGTPGPVDFSREILPIFSDNCFRCHGPDAKTRKAGLRLDLKEQALRATDPVIVPGKSDESEVILRVTSRDPDEVMPPPKSGRSLTPAQVERLKRWIDEGATWGRHWALEPPRRSEPPAVRERGWPVNPIDRFVLARLEAEGMSPSPEAERATLIRRVTLDLTGLPPAPEEVDAFLADPAPDAYERLVDRLLASPHYGERMVWEWLDAARYADSNGYQGDAERTMWPWRDWAIEALNRDLPFDQFTVWQLAGDLLPGSGVEQKLATGFCRNHMINGEGGRIAEENRVDYVMDMAETAGTVWLGLTFNCCRCHDHKYDPLTQRDYYSLFAFFNQTPVTGGGGDPQTPPVIELPSREQTTKLEALDASLREAMKAVEAMEQQLFPHPSGTPASASPKTTVLKSEVVALLDVPAGRRDRGQLEQTEKQWEAAEPAFAAQLKAQRAALDARDGFSKTIPRVMVMEDMPRPRETFLLARGSYEKPTEKVDPDVPASLPPLPPGAPRNRLGLARWLVSPDNPLTARVTVNRAWQQFFGIGLVKTPEDFGVQGEAPTHPELLDWLATEFVRTGWDLKRLHRLIVTSATYRQSSRIPPALAERDPRNRLLARGPRFRLPAWMIRDQALAASGLLVRKVGGPPVKPYQPEGVWEEATFGTKRYQRDKGEALYRRSVYTFWRRIVGPTEFFDNAARQTCVVKPTRTNTPLHALTTLNDVTYVEAARAMAERVLTTAGSSPDERVELAFRLVLARKPTAEEARVLLASVARVGREFAADREAAKKYLAAGDSPRNQALDPVEHATFAVLCSAILNLDEALIKE
ncbi:MAG: PSD1 domain-containing protein [Planctomycetaceae bacterium]|nr:PSD1 domain-containing protein [Planctomycetaceae bacterium]